MDFIVGDVPEEFINQAIRMREERDRLYGNIFTEKSSDLRWVGEIGEICFDKWARLNTTLPVEWILEEAAGKADFIIGDSSIGVKTVKRSVPARTGYTAQITAKHAMEPVEYFFFTSYEVPCKRLWLLGGIAKDIFMQNATYYGAGSKVHRDYTVREGHEIYNIEISKLTPPRLWISSLGG
ncbi:hypothetical protein [Nocardia otitidiscaviarum]|uniref:hypothetical protein n=1 Tax=Nocardia otitidiscaviarum TaxID=1823 RepID=UPI001E34672D|nr:hypothetical protein [Nocardia otitidiscaviarum]